MSAVRRNLIGKQMTNVHGSAGAEQMTIPDVRKRLFQLAQSTTVPEDIARELAVLAEATRRRSSGRKAGTRSRKVTRGLSASIRKFARENPHVPQQDVATKFSVNIGRVSEAILGKRGSRKPLN